ncbi:MAG: ABC transporter ATP-binding protein, partial [Erysipelotrichaceae bacterium]|nr:ABC transporter ATP-binding protein [Erysipelotrichaceae bacterium]
FYSSITNPSTRFVNNLVYAALGLTSAFSALDGKITIGQMSTMLSYASKYTTPFNEISSVIAELQNALACYRRIRDLLELPEERQQELYGLDVNGVRGSVDFDKVCFSYVKERPLLQDVDIHIAAGQKVAIVGPTGCGKTTLVNLLLRFYDTDSGTIRIDGIDTQQLSRDELRDCFGMVLQDSWLKEGTIRENLTMGNPDISDQQLIEACQRCHCHQFITLLKDGYDTYVRPDEEQFSAGQKQLLCITRAMLSDPRILILDEATSNIDSNTEVLVQKAFDALMQNKTSFIIAHRLSTIRNADLILVLKDGHIIEQGNHQQLLEKQGFYFTLYNSQFTSQ